MITIPNVESEYKPWGGLAGALTGERRTEQDIGIQQGLQAQGLENILKQRDAQLAESQMASPEWMEAKLQGDIGLGRKNYAEGQLAYNTLDANTKAKLQELKNTTTLAERKETIMGIENFMAAASSGTPASWSQALQMLPPQMRQAVSQMPREQVLKMASDLRNTLVDLEADTPKLRADKLLESHKGTETRKTEDVKGAWDIGKQVYANMGSANAAAIGAQKAQDTALIQLHSQTMAQINAFEREQQDYAKLIQETKSDPMFAMGAAKEARLQKDYPTKGSTADKKAYEQKYVQKKIESSEIYKKYIGLEKNIQFLRSQANQIAAGKLPQAQQVQSQDKPPVIKLD